MFINILFKRKKLILLIWLLLIILALLNFSISKKNFETGIGNIKNSESKYVSEFIQNNFPETINENLLITISNEKYIFDDNNFQNIYKSIYSLLKKQKEIRNIISPSDILGKNLISKDKKNIILIIELNEKSFSYYETYVPIIRNIIKEYNLNDFKLFVTGQAAYSYDMNFLSEKETRNAEIKVLLLTLIVLVFAFASFKSALIPVIIGFLSTFISISILKLINEFYTLSMFCQNISSMLGLALGIDYSLLILTRLRKELEFNNIEQAIINTYKTSGLSVFYSGLSVLIGFFALFIPNTNITTSIGIGGIFVVLSTLLTTFFLLPIILLFTDNKAYYKINIPNIEKNWVGFVIKNRLAFLFSSLFIIIILSLPILKIKLAEPDIRTMPSSMESKKGFEILEKISESNIVFSMDMIIKVKENNIKNMKNIVSIYNFIEELKKDTRIKDILGIYSLEKNLPLNYYIFSSFSENTLFEKYLVSKDYNDTLFKIYPDKNLSSYEINKLIEEIRLKKNNNLEIFTGGPATLGYDLMIKLYSSFHLIILFVFIVTFINLYIAFKSIIIPIKAIFLNSLAVLSSYGFLVLVFQYGYFKDFFYIENIPESVIAQIPVILFCIMFSLSMDYEVFIINSIYEYHLKGEDNYNSILKGLNDIAPVIIKASLIMLIVFGAFIFADIIIIKMVGIGLFTAVLLDASIIRMILIPIFMYMFGKLNWYSPFKNN